MEALLLPGPTTAILGGVFLYFLINQLKSEDKKTLSIVLFSSSVLFSFITLVAFTGVVSKIDQFPALLRGQGFTPEGGYLPAAIFLGSILPLGIGLFLSERQASKKAFLGVASLVVAMGVIISVYNILPGKQFSPRFPSMSTSWSIAVDSLKASPILGVGPGNYLTAFNRFRPIEYNATDLWAIKFATARSFLFTLITEAGLLATAGIILLLYSIYKTARRDLKEQKLVNWGFPAIANLTSLVLLVIFLLLFPATVLVTALFFIYLSLYSKTKHTSLNLTAQGNEETTSGGVIASRFPALLITIPVVIGVIFASYRAGRILVAEYQFKMSLDALARNDASKTYDTMRQAIRTNPYVDRYHASFARVNLVLANAIAQRAQGGTQGTQGTEPTTISEGDRSTITTLVQQAIAEGKSTVALNPLRAGNWEILAETYRAIMPLAQGADAFAIQSYRQAVALDPLNPNLRIALGGIHYGKKDFESAVKILELAVATKPDHANARYNFSFALLENGNLERAIAEMTAVLSLITDKNSTDFAAAQKALSDMQAKKNAQAPSGEKLTPPQEAQEPTLEPPLNLPEGSEPPEAPLSPTPSPKPEVSGEISVTPSISPSLTVTPTPAQ
jgi:tetratricopeptide (TPR) repeat protein